MRLHECMSKPVRPPFLSSPPLIPSCRVVFPLTFRALQMPKGKPRVSSVNFNLARSQQK
jgi:hypothetical protein